MKSLITAAVVLGLALAVHAQTSGTTDAIVRRWAARYEVGGVITSDMTWTNVPGTSMLVKQPGSTPEDVLMTFQAEWYPSGGSNVFLRPLVDGNPDPRYVDGYLIYSHQIEHPLMTSVSFALSPMLGNHALEVQWRVDGPDVAYMQKRMILVWTR